jgi:hypothetical protein
MVLLRVKYVSDESDGNRRRHLNGMASNPELKRWMVASRVERSMLQSRDVRFSVIVSRWQAVRFWFRNCLVAPHV